LERYKVLISLKVKLLFVSPCWRSVYLIEKRMKGLNPPQLGLEVDDTTNVTRAKGPIAAAAHEVG
jgi:hypothetical protein